MMRTWREGGVLLGVNCVKVKQKTKIINIFLFCFCIKNMLAVILSLAIDLFAAVTVCERMCAVCRRWIYQS